MSAKIASEIWSELQRYISSVDRDESAETLVSILIDNDIDAEEIKSAFKGDLDIKRALLQYLDETEEDPEEDDDIDDPY